MDRFFRPVVLGFFSPFVSVLGAEPFEAFKGNWFLLPSLTFLGLYLVICEFFVGRKERRNRRALWPTMAAMSVPLLIWFVILVVVEKPTVVVQQGLPMLITGVIAILAGAMLSARGKALAPPFRP